MIKDGGEGPVYIQMCGRVRAATVAKTPSVSNWMDAAAKAHGLGAIPPTARLQVAVGNGAALEVSSDAELAAALLLALRRRSPGPAAPPSPAASAASAEPAAAVAAVVAWDAASDAPPPAAYALPVRALLADGSGPAVSATLSVAAWPQLAADVQQLLALPAPPDALWYREWAPGSDAAVEMRGQRDLNAMLAYWESAAGPDQPVLLLARQ